MKRSGFEKAAIFGLYALISFSSFVFADDDGAINPNSSYNDFYFPGDCPALCNVAGPNPANWTRIHSISDLIQCNETAIFDLNVQNDLDSPDTILTLRACMAKSNDSLDFSPAAVRQAQEDDDDNADPGAISQPILVSSNCEADVTKISVTPEIAGMPNVQSPRAGTSPQADDVVSAARSLAMFIKSGALCGTSIFFAKSGSAVVGLYAGAQVTKNAAKDFLNSFAQSQETQVMQICRPTNAALTVGAFAATIEHLSSAQSAVKSWTNGLCLNDTTATSATKMEVLVADAQDTSSSKVVAARSRIVPDIPHAGAICKNVQVRPGDGCASLTQRCSISDSAFAKYNPSTSFCSTLRPGQHACCSPGAPPDDDVESQFAQSGKLNVAWPLSLTNNLYTRANCRDIQVNSGDSCASLARRCKISGPDFMKYNPSKNLCSTLQPQQHVCCSPGTLPDHRPKPQPDGTCATYHIKSGDGCYDIAKNHYLEVTDINNFNKRTWGWAGCNALQPGQVICLSSGKPPMPAIVQGTVCGPQVPGTKRPADGVDISTLNPCPLNACCDIWGFCGTTADFCTKTPAGTGAPGTARPGTNGCISNCGTDIVNNGSPPQSFRSIGYFEGFDQNRDCLNMEVDHIPADVYTHVHFAFASITPSYTVSIVDVYGQFAKFTKMSGFKKVLSFGGWAFSTEQSTFRRFRDATKPENRNKFVNSLVEFLNNNDLDGLDFDWEYPGAPDIPDITPGSPDEGANYLGFLKLLRSRIPDGKTLSIALPASFWYLKAYPVKEIAPFVDYFIYMTYDLHGQWDVGNKWAIPSCEGGNCLRSHVNKTETRDALAMLTKAGVSSPKIVVGISSYGRSFRMADPSCSGPFCKYTGGRGNSMAYPGKCTSTGGYIANAEINNIIKNPGKYSVVKSSVDAVSQSNILMYGVPGAVDWVAYLDGDAKRNRINWIKGLNFGGTTDWAIDLQSMEWDDDHDDGNDSDSSGLDKSIPDTCPPGDNPGDLQALADKSGSLPGDCASLYAIDNLYQQLLDSLDLFQVNSKGYDDLFGYYAQWTKDQIQPRLDEFVHLSDGPGLKYMTCYYSIGRRPEQKSSCTGMPHFWEQDSVWTLRFQLDDENGFYDELLSDFGVDRSWVTWGGQRKTSECVSPSPESPAPGGPSRPCRNLVYTWENYPKKGDDSKIQIGNPKALIEASMSNITALQTSMISSYLDTALTFYSDGPEAGNPFDAVVAYAMPIFQMAEAIDSMADIKKIGAKARDQERKDFILKILTIVFMVIPFVGDALGPIFGSAASVARIALLIGEAGNAALTIADIVEDPSSAPFAILGLIAGVGGVSDLGRVQSLQKASSVRKLLKDTDLAKFPQRFKDRDAIVQSMVKNVCAARKV